MTIELKFSKAASEKELGTLARQALAQVAERAYDTDIPDSAHGRPRWGIAFSGRHVVAACERAE